jgi:superoxide dismutase
MLELIQKDEKEISELFSKQISNIGFILFSLSLTQIPLLIIVMLCAKKKYLEYVSKKISYTENVYKHISWDMLSDNTYAVNYFEDKLKKA